MVGVNATGALSALSLPELMHVVIITSVSSLAACLAN